MHENNNKYIVSLVDSSRKGSKNAFLQLCELNLGDIYSLCFLITGDTSLAYQFARRVFLDAWKNIKQIRVDTSFNSWLHGFAIFYVLDEIRKREANKESLKPSTAGIGKAKQSRIGNFLLNLTPWERVVVVLHDLEKYSYIEINDLLWQFSPDEIKNLVRSARKKYLDG